MDMELYDGIICPSPYAIQRIVFTGANGNIKGQPLHIWQYDSDTIAGMSEEDIDNYLVTTNGSTVDFLDKARPSKHWTAPYVTHHKYYARWHYGLDFESVSV